jgi:hypothetical protein
MVANHPSKSFSKKALAAFRTIFTLSCDIAREVLPPRAVVARPASVER